MKALATVTESLEKVRDGEMEAGERELQGKEGQQQVREGMNSHSRPIVGVSITTFFLTAIIIMFRRPSFNRRHRIAQNSC